jgi:hypothetical protein
MGERKAAAWASSAHHQEGDLCDCTANGEEIKGEGRRVWCKELELDC